MSEESLRTRTAHIWVIAGTVGLMIGLMIGMDLHPPRPILCSTGDGCVMVRTDGSMVFVSGPIARDIKTPIGEHVTAN